MASPGRFTESKDFPTHMVYVTIWASKLFALVAFAKKAPSYKSQNDKGSQNVNKNDSSYYSKLKIYKNRRFWLTVLCFTLIATGSVGFALANLKGDSKTVVFLALAALSSLTFLIPPTEEWDYQPWQAKPQLVEKDIDRR